jgi:hypothetical protein
MAWLTQVRSMVWGRGCLDTVNLFRFEELVHRACGHGVCAMKRIDGWDKIGNNGIWERRS